MLHTKRLLLASAALVSLTTAAAAENWYGSLGAGANWVDEHGGTAIITTLGPTLTNFEAEFDAGWAVLGAGGYRWGNWRAELELGYRDNDVDGFTTFPFGFAATSFSGGVTQFSQMLNLIYDIHISDSWTFSLGAGGGGAWVEMEVDGTATFGNTIQV